jgi:hypothetical protein
MPMRPALPSCPVALAIDLKRNELVIIETAAFLSITVIDRWS